MPVRRMRGVVLRLVRRRPLAVLLGAAMVAPAVWLELGASNGVWWLDGLALIVGATGGALLWAGLTGARGDWVDQ
jgi:hypothetical protein